MLIFQPQHNLIVINHLRPLACIHRFAQDAELLHFSGLQSECAQHCVAQRSLFIYRNAYVVDSNLHVKCGSVWLPFAKVVIFSIRREGCGA